MKSFMHIYAYVHICIYAYGIPTRFGYVCVFAFSFLFLFSKINSIHFALVSLLSRKKVFGIFFLFLRVRAVS